MQIGETGGFRGKILGDCLARRGCSRPVRQRDGGFGKFSGIAGQLAIASLYRGSNGHFLHISVGGVCWAVSCAEFSLHTDFERIELVLVSGSDREDNRGASWHLL